MVRLYYHCGHQDVCREPILSLKKHYGESRETVLSLRQTMVSVGGLNYHSDIPW